MEAHSEEQSIVPASHSDGGSTSSDATWATFLSGIDGFSDDIFQDGRDQGIHQERETM